MGENRLVKGMVLKAMPIGDFDKRITILTAENGKINAFVRGARRQNSAMLASSNPFCFGDFELFEGRNSYTVSKATISNYFRKLTSDFDIVCMGFYFLEFADFFCQENNDEQEMLKLLYHSLRVLEVQTFSPAFVRMIFEWRALAVNGIGPSVFSCMHCGKKTGPFSFSIPKSGIFCKECSKGQKEIRPISEAALYVLQFIATQPLKKLYTFTAREDIQEELFRLIKNYMDYHVQHTFKSLDMKPL